MDVKVVESHLEYIAGKVIDEDEIVTYKSLSRNLNIHVNTAKQLLYNYFTNEKSNKTYSISATYLIAGKVLDGSINISIVNESDLKTAQQKLIQITSQHIYSVQKGKNLNELKCLCGINKNSKSSTPVIKYYKNVLKPKEVKKKPKYDEVENEKVIKQALVTPKETVATEPVKNSETTTATDASHKKTSPKGNAEKAKGNNKKVTGNIANLFAKANQKNAEKSAAKVESLKDEKKSDVGNGEEVKNDKNIERGTSKRRSESRESVKRNKKASKRRRIQMASDSEESGSDSEEHVEIFPEEEPSPPPATINLEEEMEETKEFVSKNKRKKRKVVDKTFMSEDGYLETKKEVVFETDSESEHEEATKVKGEKKPNSDKGKGLQGPKKQSSLLSFFKKS